MQLHWPTACTGTGLLDSSLCSCRGPQPRRPSAQWTGASAAWQRSAEWKSERVCAASPRRCARRASYNCSPAAASPHAYHTQAACVRLAVAVVVVPTKAHILQPRFVIILIRLYTTSALDGTEPRGRVTQVLTLSRRTRPASMILRLESTLALPAEALRAA